jgi:hypothetical protein
MLKRGSRVTFGKGLHALSDVIHVSIARSHLMLDAMIATD